VDGPNKILSVKEQADKEIHNSLLEINAKAHSRAETAGRRLVDKGNQP
jgi:hypothetical protein